MPFRTLREKDFIGRSTDLSGLYHRAMLAERGLLQSILITGPRGVGKTELLKQLFNQLFWKQETVAPFYYRVSPAVLTMSDLARDLLTRFLHQRIAFEKKERVLLDLMEPSLDDLLPFLTARETGWARELIERTRSGTAEPLHLLRIALGSLRRSALATGKPVVIIFDEFHRFRDYHAGGIDSAGLSAHFEELFLSNKTPCLIAGNDPDIFEMAVTGGLGRVAVEPLAPQDATTLFTSLMTDYGSGAGDAPPELHARLGGIPLYLRCLAAAAGQQGVSDAAGFQDAYARELVEGALAHYWSSAFQAAIPEPQDRRTSLELCDDVCRAGEPITAGRMAAARAMDVRRVESLLQALRRAGFVTGDYGAFSLPTDGVRVDFLLSLCAREIRGKSPAAATAELAGPKATVAAQEPTFELVLPKGRDAELVAAQCLAQIGKNFGIHEEIIGQIQIALIEACINALEHGNEEDHRVKVIFHYSPEQLEIAIESSGREFVSPETGEPFFQERMKDEAGRGWGLKLMQKFADDVRFERAPGGTRVILVKHLKKKGVKKEGAVNGR